MDHLYYKATIEVLFIVSENLEEGARWSFVELDDVLEPTMLHQR